ncbi:MAG: response regulator [Deltaproteobacteria bacterium]|nr:MAG: response regulator [Deltaproteobacteria bacterium]
MQRKKPIGKVLIEKQAVDSRSIGAALQRQTESGGRLASNLLEMGLAAEEDLLAALSDQLGLPAVDLSRSILVLENLDIVPREVAEQSGIIPLKVEEERILLGMVDPRDEKTISEIQFVTGKKVEPYVVLQARLSNVIQQAYPLRKRDPNEKYYVGPRVDEQQRRSVEGVYLAVVSGDVPSPDMDVEPEEELILVEVAEEDDGDAQGARDSSAGPLVLVVDDELDILRMLEKALRSDGFEVITAQKGLEALQMVKQHNPSLILLDAMLPEIHGFEICRKIKSSRKFSHIPVIMISAIYRGWRYAEDVRAAYGADDYFEKPFKLVPLLRRVRELLKLGPSPADVAMDPKAAADAYRNGVALYKEGKYAEAEAALREALALSPFNANIHYALANVMLAQKRYYDAIREYENTIELKPNLFAPLRNLAILYQRKGFRHKAVEMWERALVCSPDEETKKNVRQQLLKLLD